jgi:hypothetical protein
MRAGRRVGAESLEDLRLRSAAQLELLPPRLRLPPSGSEPDPYPVRYSEALRDLAVRAPSNGAPATT